jgi:glycine cleavage system aminomethyltransferase T/glycine/D-amino acid oxidase-like deaminating enzyme
VQKSYRLIIVGGGIVGSSVAHHLSLLGWEDILVLDKGPLFENDGSTSHAPGGMHLANSSRLMTNFAKYSVEAYKQLDEIEEGNPPVRQVGGIEIAHTPERLEELKRKAGYARAYGVEAHLLTPKELKDKLPFVDESITLGAYYCPTDTNVLGAHVTESLARSAFGATIQIRTPVTELLTRSDGRVIGVKTPEGDFHAENVLLCTNIWAPLLASQVGVKLPLMAAQHQYTVTEPLECLREYKDREIVFPIVRAQDFSVYYRQHWDSWGVGNYRHEPLMVWPRLVGETAMRDFTPEHYEVAKKATADLFPGTREVGLKRAFNGMFAFTLDGFPLMGPTYVPGLWVGTGVWITHAGGVGKTLAEWLDTGTTEWDISEADVARLHSHQTTRTYTELRCSQNYREVYDIIHPRQPLGEPRGLKKAPFHNRLEKLGAHFFESGGWEMPQWYESNKSLLEEFKDDIPPRDEWASRFWSPIQGAEHLAVRKSCGLFSLAALAVIEVRGPGARTYLDGLTANRIAPAPRLTYTAFLDQNAGIRADLTLVERDEDCFWVFTGGAILPRDLNWLQMHLPEDGSVELVDLSSSMTAVGIWGPKARDILQSVSDAQLSNKKFPFYQARQIDVGTVRVDALRLSYAGELGWELHTLTEHGDALWEALWEAGQAHGLIAAGGGAFDSLRLEKGYRLWGTDMDTEKNPYEAGLGMFVKPDKGYFLGRAALMANEEPRKKLCCLETSTCFLGKEPIYHEDLVVGYVTSANYGYSVKKWLAYGYLPVALSEPGQILFLEYFGKQYAARVVEDPVFDPESTRMRS